MFFCFVSSASELSWRAIVVTLLVLIDSVDASGKHLRLHHNCAVVTLKQVAYDSDINMGSDNSIAFDSVKPLVPYRSMMFRNRVVTENMKVGFKTTCDVDSRSCANRYYLDSQSDGMLSIMEDKGEQPLTHQTVAGDLMYTTKPEFNTKILVVNDFNGSKEFHPNMIVEYITDKIHWEAINFLDISGSSYRCPYILTASVHNKGHDNVDVDTLTMVTSDFHRNKHYQVFDSTQTPDSSNYDGPVQDFSVSVNIDRKTLPRQSILKIPLLMFDMPCEKVFQDWAEIGRTSDEKGFMPMHLEFISDRILPAGRFIFHSKGSTLRVLDNSAIFAEKMISFEIDNHPVVSYHRIVKETISRNSRANNDVNVTYVLKNMKSYGANVELRLSANSLEIVHMTLNDLRFAAKTDTDGSVIVQGMLDANITTVLTVIMSVRT